MVSGPHLRTPWKSPAFCRSTSPRSPAAVPGKAVAGHTSGTTATMGTVALCGGDADDPAQSRQLPTPGCGCLAELQLVPRVQRSAPAPGSRPGADRRVPALRLSQPRMGTRPLLQPLRGILAEILTPVVASVCRGVAMVKTCNVVYTVVCPGNPAKLQGFGIGKTWRVKGALCAKVPPQAPPPEPSLSTYF